MIDPDDVVEQRRRSPRPPRVDVPSPQASESVDFARTMQRLEAERAGDHLARPRRWLAVVRGDRRPITPAELDAAVAEIAAQDGASVADVVAGLDAALASEGRGDSLKQWRARLGRPRPRIGKAAAAAQLQQMTFLRGGA